MAYTPIDPAIIKVGDPIVKELWDQIRDNFIDHETRLQTLGGGSGKVNLINDDFLIASPSSLTGVAYYEVIQDCIIIEASMQLFAKGGATSGNLEIDIKKGTSTNPAGFTSIFTTKPILNMASASDYQKKLGTINGAAQALSIGNILKVDITGLPTNLKGFRVTVIGEF